MEIGGHYTYYEKNPCMQNYMISARKKNGVFPTETVEDRAAKDFRNLVRAKGEGVRKRKSGGMMYAASACLVLVLIVMGVSMVNNFDKMKAVQSTLDSLSGQTDIVETQETSGTVTAVTSEEDAAGVGEETREEDGESDDAQTQDSGQPADEGQDGSAEETAAGGEAADSGTEDSGTADSGTAGSSSSDSGSSDSTDVHSSKSGGADSSGENGSNGIYVVEKGDTLAIISRKMYGDLTHVDAICRMNGITDGNLIYVGQKLLLP